MEVKVGYKQTDIGIVPEDWNVFELGEIVSYTKGFAFKSIDYQSDGIRIIRVSDTTYASIKDDTAVYIATSKLSEYTRWKLRENDLIITTVGSKPPMWNSLVGKVIRIDKKYTGSLLNQNAVLIRAKNNSGSIQYILLNNLRTERYIKHIQDIFRGNANQASITLEELFKFQVTLPKEKAEQEAIAEALSDADALIEALEQLIAKKRQVKQGAMQELLTGKRRLPGFSGEWKWKTFGDAISKCFSGATPSRARPEYFKGDIRWITSTELNYNVITDTAEKITPEAVRSANLKMLPKNTFLMAITGLEAEGTRGRCGIVGKPSTSNQSCMALFPTNELLVQYLFHYYVYAGDRLALEYCQGTKQQSYTAQTVKLLPIYLPPVSEQRAIAEILSDMDAEIAALEAKLAKARQVKQGMMQELLTGRIRLV